MASSWALHPRRHTGQARAAADGGQVAGAQAGGQRSRAADASVVHFEDLLVALEHQRVVDTHLERRHAGFLIAYSCSRGTATHPLAVGACLKPPSQPEHVCLGTRKPSYEAPLPGLVGWVQLGNAGTHLSKLIFDDRDVLAVVACAGAVRRGGRVCPRERPQGAGGWRRNERPNRTYRSKWN